MRVHCLVNDRSGRRRVGADAVRDAFRGAGVGEADLVVQACSTPRSLAALIGAALESRPDVLVAAGGDGTVSAVAARLAGCSTPLGVLPSGSLNHFARDLGMPLELEAAAVAIVSGRTRAIDLGEVNGRPFINNAGLGVYPHALRVRDRWRQRLGKWPAAALGMAAAIARWPRLELEVALPGETLRGHLPLLFVGNNRYAVGWPQLGSRERLDEGRLSVIAAREPTRRALVRALWLAARARPVGAAVANGSVAALEVVDAGSRRSRVRASLDGELVRLELPLRFRALPGALRVRVP